MARQDGRQALRTCSACGERRRDVERASERILPPSGGLLCGDCLIQEILYPSRVKVQ